jgi:hypothetical protein
MLFDQGVEVANRAVLPTLRLFYEHSPVGHCHPRRAVGEDHKTDRSWPVALDAAGIALLVDYQARVDRRPGNQRPIILDDGFVFSP